MLRRLHKRQEGDTIVEVLISLAILTLILGGAYYTANLSFRNDRDSQEHTEALTVAQTQLEDLRAYGDSYSSSSPQFEDTPSCLDDSSGTLRQSADCQIPSNATSSNDSQCPSTAPFCYLVSITGPTTTSITQVINGQTINTPLNTYKINVTWTALAGGSDDVTLYYRVDAG